ncbi:putative MFS family arabinose efflux permease [Motilibacter peucedani]|uniref:Putative MFS family arabinose efflux permease n=2 Tax=Motilibacter peucedani TaxID=598650 RepID=A0A420XQ47_9ACTN|nr:MFS transporter [Motilibacter peucedani]RKS75377.1 putative MFS family arabinose efflux permease [Motilibacter peucedani]
MSNVRLGRLRRVALDVAPLQTASYRRLWMAESVSAIGVQLTAVAVAIQVFDLTGSSLWVGALGAVGFVPLVVLGLWGGSVADAVDRRRLILVAATCGWVCTLGLLVNELTGLHSLTLLLLLVAVQSGAFAVSQPALNAVIPRLLEPRLVPAANTLAFTTFNAATVVGPLFASFLLHIGGYGVAYGGDALLFTAMLYAVVRLPPIEPTGHTSSPGLRSVLDGLQFIGTRPVLLLSFVIDIIAMVFAMPRAMFPQAAAEWFGGKQYAGWLYAAIALGAVLGGLSSGWIGRVRRQGLALVAAVVGWGLAVAAAGLARTLWLAVVLLAVAGAADLVSAVYRQTLLQVYAPDEMRGRMQGVFTVVVAGGPRLGDLRAGASVAGFGLAGAWVGGGLVCAVLVVVLVALAPALRRYTAVQRDTVTP